MSGLTLLSSIPPILCLLCCCNNLSWCCNRNVFVFVRVCVFVCLRARACVHVCLWYKKYFLVDKRLASPQEEAGTLTYTHTEKPVELWKCVHAAHASMEISSRKPVRSLSSQHLLLLVFILHCAIPDLSLPVFIQRCLRELSHGSSVFSGTG